MTTAPDPSPNGRPVLAVIGDLVEDIVVWASDTRRGTDNTATVTRTRGGSAANVAVHAAPLVNTRFIGRVGRDAVGSSLAALLAERGVDTRLQYSDDAPTGVVVVIVDPTGERTMYPARGAAAQLQPIDPAWLDGVTALHLPAYGLADEASRAALIGAAAVVRNHGGHVSVDVSAASLVDELGRDAFVAVLDGLHPEIVFANADEARALGIVEAPAVPAGPLWVIKQGAGPAVARSAGVADVVVTPAAVLDAVDTTGAGDAFAAGFLAAHLHGAAVAEALAAGHAAAGVVVGAPGAG